MAVQLHTHPEHVLRTARYVYESSLIQNHPMGRRLMRLLGEGAASQIRDTDLDPTYKDLSYDEVLAWIDDHLVFNDDGDVIALVSGDKVLWEEL